LLSKTHEVVGREGLDRGDQDVGFEEGGGGGGGGGGGQAQWIGGEYRERTI